MKVVLLSAYDAESHARWHRGLCNELQNHQITTHTLPARWFAWRTGSAALTWATGVDDLWRHSYDVVLTTSITDVAALRGLVRSLADTPIISYFHENQFAYPTRGERQDARLLIQTIQSALASDLLVFNTKFNRNTFIDGACEFLASMPDHQPEFRERLLKHSRVLPVPLERECFTDSGLPRQERLIWNHRWEWDKAPDRLFGALRLLKQEGLTPKVALVGQSFRQVPKEIRSGIEEFEDQLDFVGFQDRAVYREILRTSSHVVSTALHEFQGLAVAEACAAGCVPIVPNRLSYVEIFSEDFRYPSFPDDAACEAIALAAHIKTALGEHQAAPDLRHLSWESLASSYEMMLSDALALKR